MFFDFGKENIVSAWIQGGCTIVAGILALLAGYLAYQAATRQIRLEEKKEESKRIAYRLMMKGVVEQSIGQLKASNYTYQNGDIMGGNLYVPSVCLQIFSVPKELKNKNWVNFSMLNEKEIKSIQEIVELINLNNFYILDEKIDHMSNIRHNPERFGENDKKEYEDAQKELKLIREFKSYDQISEMSQKDWYDNYEKIISILDDVYQSLS